MSKCQEISSSIGVCSYEYPSNWEKQEDQKDEKAVRTVTDMTVVINDNRIARLSKGGKVKIPKGAKVIDAKGKFLIPGLWDMHVHVLRKGRIDSFFPLLIANGVTGVRDLGATREDFALLKQWRDEIANGTRIAPRIIAAGIIVDCSNPVVPKKSIAVGNEEEARQQLCGPVW